MVAIIGYFLLSQNCPRRFVVKSMSLLLLANHVDLEWLNTDNDESKHVYMLHLDKGLLSLAKGSEGISREKTSFTLAFCL